MNEDRKDRYNSEEECNSHHGNGKGTQTQRARNKINRRSAREYSNPGKYMPSAKEPRSSLNDVSWYTRHPLLLQAAASLPFVNKAGMVVDAGTFSIDLSAASSPQRAKYGIPGVAAIRYNYAFGYSDNDLNSPPSIATQELFSIIRNKFSGTLKIDPPDCIFFLMGLDQIHAWVAEAKRLYRAANVFSGENYDYPYRVWNALTCVNHLDIDDVRQHRMEMLSGINLIIAALNQINFPAFMDLFNRHRWMNEHIYADEPRANAQSYVFVPNGYYHVNVTGETGTKLVFQSADKSAGSSTYKLTVAEYIQRGWDMLSAFKQLEDVFTTNGYFGRAFENVPNLMVAELLIGETQNPVYEAEVLDQIHNIRAVGEVTNLDITQNPATGAIVCTPTLVKVGSAKGDVITYPAPIIDIPMDNPSPAVVAVATRLTPSIVRHGKNYELHPATEYVTKIQLYTAGDDVLGIRGGQTLTSYECLSQGMNAEFDVIKWATINETTAFGAFPKIWLQYQDPVEPSNGKSVLTGSTSNIMTCTEDQLQLINFVCVLSEFNCFGKDGNGSRGLT